MFFKVPQSSTPIISLVVSIFINDGKNFFKSSILFPAKERIIFSFFIVSIAKLGPAKTDILSVFKIS